MKNSTPRLGGGGRSFRALFCTQFLGAFNDNLYKMIVSLLSVGAAIEVGGTGGIVSAAGIVFVLPYLLFSGYAGYLADRFDKRSVLIVSKALEIAVMALALLALLAGRTDLLLATLFLMAAQSTFFSPAKYGILPEMLPAALLPRANGALEFGRYGAVIFGTAGGGALLSLLVGRPALIGAVLIAVACLGTLASFGVRGTPQPAAPKAFRANPWAETASGLRRLVQDRNLALAVGGITYFEFFGSFVLLDVLLAAKETMALDDLATGLLGAVAGIGVGAGAFAAGRLSRGRVELGLVPIGATGFAFALLWASAAVGGYFGFAAAIACVGAFGGLFVVPLIVLLQAQAGANEKGHLIATNNFFNMFGVLAACAALWLLRDVAGVPPARILLLSGGLALLAAGAMLRFLPGLRTAAAAWLGESRRLGAASIVRLGRAAARFAAAVVPVLAIAGADLPARAGEAASGRYAYTVRHSLLGEVGTHTVALARNGNETVVALEIQVDARLLAIPVLRLHVLGRETWRDGRLIAYEGLSFEDGAVTELSARAEAGGYYVVRGASGENTLAGPLSIANPWSSAVLDGSAYIEPTSGELLVMRAGPAEEVSVEVAGRSRRASKRLLRGDLEAAVWFAEDGTWLRMEFPRYGGRVSVELRSFTPALPAALTTLAASF